MSTPEKETPKKPYHPPRLVEYGDLRQLTESSNTQNTSDGAYGTALRTG